MTTRTLPTEVIKMSSMITSIGLAFLAVFVAGCAQIILKKAALRYSGNTFLQKFLNPPVIIGYGMMFGSSFLNVIALRQMPLSLTPVTEATGYIWVPLLSWIFLKVRPTRQNLTGGAIIIAGMLLYAFGA